MKILSFLGKSIKKSNKYFLVFYVGTSIEEPFTIGSASVLYPNCLFPKRIDFEKSIKEKTGLAKLSITNLIEITKEQYDCWISE